MSILWTRLFINTKAAQEVSLIITAVFRDRMGKSRKNEREHFHIFSLTEVPDNETMWMNYADNYNGICLGFETNTVLQKSDCNFTDKNECFFIETLDQNLDVDARKSSFAQKR